MSANRLAGPARGAFAAPGAAKGLSLFLTLLGGALAVTGFGFKLSGASEEFGVIDGLAYAGAAAFAAGLALSYAGAYAAWARRKEFARWGAMSADYAWPPDGVQVQGSWREAAGSAATTALLPAACAVWFPLRMDLDFAAGAVVGLVVAAAVGAVSWAVFGGPLRQFLRYGAARLKLPPGPVQPGRAVFAELEAGADLARAAVTLRCVRETVEGSGKHRSVVREQVGEGRVGDRQATTTGLQFTLEAPAEGPGTDLGGRPAVYWELFVADAEAEFEAYFLVPVYPAAPR